MEKVVTPDELIFDSGQHWIIPKTNCNILLPILVDILLKPVFKEENLER